MTKIQSLFARLVLVLTVLFATAPMVGCNENRLPDMQMVGDKGSVTTGQYNITRGIERNWYAANNRGEFLTCWAIVLLLPWGIFLGVSGWMFGRFEKPGEIASLLAATGLMWRWASMLDLEPWLLICWIAPCIVYVFLKGEEKKFKVFFAFQIPYLIWTVWLIWRAISNAFTYHPIIMIVVTIVAVLLFSGSGDEKHEAHGDAHH